MKKPMTRKKALQTLDKIEEMLKPKLKKVTSINELRNLAEENLRYKELAMSSARNLGGENIDGLEAAIRWLYVNAHETSEKGVVGEINYCRDLV